MERRFNSFLDGLLSGDVVVSVTEQKTLGPKVGSQIGGGLRSAPDGMSFVDITGRVDGDNDGIVFEGIPGMERPIIPRFLVPTNLAGKLSKLVEGDSLEIERQRRAGNTNIEFDENKFNSIISSLKEESSRTREFVSPKRRKISERTNDGSRSRSTSDSSGDYRGQHGAPVRGAGAPLHDMMYEGGIYPEDVYSANAIRYYGVGDDKFDRMAASLIQEFRGKPNAELTIYRTVPMSTSKKIEKLEKQLARYMRRGKLPDGVDRRIEKSDWSQSVRDEIERLKKLPPDNIKINTGDWVTPFREYAVEHGHAALNGEYEIIKKRVKAKQIWTAGDSWLEWGYDPTDDSGSSRSKRAFPPVPTLDTPEKREDGKKNSIFGRRLGTVRGKNKYRDGSPSSSAVGSFEEEGDDGEEYTVKNYFESVTFVRDLENLLTGKKKTVTGMYDSNEVEVPDVSNEIQSVMTNMRTALGRVGKIPPDVLYATIVERYGEDSFEKIISQLYGRKKKTEVEQEIFFHTLKNLIYSLNFSDQVLTEEDINRGKRKITPDDVGTLLRHMGYSKVHGERLSTFTETVKRLHALKRYEDSRPDIVINPKLSVDLSDLRARLDRFKDFTMPNRFKSRNDLRGASFIDWTSGEDDEMNDSMSALLDAGERILNQWEKEISRISDSGLLAELESIKEKLTRSTSSKEDISNKKDELENKIFMLAMRDAASYLSPESQKDIEDIIKSFTSKDGSLISKKPFALKILEIIEREPIGEGIARLNDAFGGRPDGVSLRKIIELNNAGISEVNNVEIENAKDYLARYWYFRARGYGSGRKDERSIYYPSVDDKGEVSSVWATVRKDKTRNIDVIPHSGFRNRIFFKRDDDSYYNPFDLDEEMLNEFEMLKDSLHQEWVSKDTKELVARRTEINNQLAQDRVEALMNVLRATRPGYGESSESFQNYFNEIIGGEGYTQEETREMIERIRSIFPEEWVAALLKSISKKDIVWRKRGYFAEDRLVPAVALDSRGFTVLAHEIGHGVEGLPGITNAETIFFRKIGLDFGWTDATAKKIKINSSGTEMAYDYKLMGEGSEYVSKTYPYENFELLTMGIEALLVRGDAISKFDERYLNFLLGMLGAL